MLTKKTASYFQHKVRSKGEQYARAGRVDDLTVEEDYIVASVRGSERYAVDIEIEPRARGWLLKAGCTCPYAVDNLSLCKHIWATIYQVQQDYLDALGSIPSRIDVRLDASITANVLGSVKYHTQMRVHDRPTAPKKKKKKAKSQRERPPVWMRQIQQAAPFHRPEPIRLPEAPIGPLIYIVDANRSRERDVLTIALMQRSSPPQTARAGSRARTRPGMQRIVLRASDVSRLADPMDRLICGMLTGAARPRREYAYSYHTDRYRAHDSGNNGSHLWQIDPRLAPTLLSAMTDTQRLEWREREDVEPRPLTWSTQPWELVLRLAPAKDKVHALGRPGLRPCARSDEATPAPATDAPVMALDDEVLVLDGEPGLVLVQRGQAILAPLEDHGALNFARSLAAMPSAQIREDELPQLLDAMRVKELRLPVLWPENWNVRELNVQPRGRITFDADGAYVPASATAARIEFEYGGKVIASGCPEQYLRPGDGDPEPLTLIRRDPLAEHSLLARAGELGVVRSTYGRDQGDRHVKTRRMPAAAAALLSDGWTVLAGKSALRPPGQFKINVASGIDWFELQGEVEFGDGASADVAAILEALKKGDQIVRLGDGSLGMLPEEWLARHGRWLRLGKPGENGSAGSLRFSRAQVGIIDALLAEMPEATCDEQVAQARQRLATFNGVRARKETASFRGELRPYQREGLGWMEFLAEFGFGGILADDMGLGKTVQLLAHLADVRERGGKGPWLVVAPKSLVFNWAREAERFTPHLKVLPYAGTERRAMRAQLDEYDLVLTTYHTMRLDVQHLRQTRFACIVLDEAQAIKNHASQVTKAARLLAAERRLALTGTPVENRLEELWSILDFLNPGMLGAASAFREVVGSGEHTDPGLIRRAVRPFILRRTKERVAPELPERSEQTLTCEMTPAQRSLYNGLLRHYRESLLGKGGRIDSDGLNKSRIHVLEALLRLRQAACHPALIETKPMQRTGAGGKTSAKKSTNKKGRPSSGANGRAGGKHGESAKIETLMEMLEEVIGEQHKALVFSQFTSMLALVRDELQRRGLECEYLDGATSAKDRAAAVDRFQSDPASRIFLISLKAGGVGLNLTAADYVFLLDPWWNPAVEAQAIDRAHRIGQDKNVIAYRLIARGTVEERIQELQAGKRELAQAVVGDDATAGSLSSLTKDELAWLLA